MIKQPLRPDISLDHDFKASYYLLVAHLFDMHGVQPNYLFEELIISLFDTEELAHFIFNVFVKKI